jgi:crotonobetaine/carnitine-CoA ligase
LSPDAEAHIDTHGRSYTFQESFDRAMRLAAGLRSHGADNGDRVALFLDNSLDFVHLWLATGLTGPIEVPINTAYKGTFLTHVLNDSAAEILVTESKYLGRVLAVADELEHLRVVVVRGDDPVPNRLTDKFTVVALSSLEDHGAASAQDQKPDGVIAYMYTSGTTGTSKGVVITQAHAYTYSSREDSARPDLTDRYLVTLPLFHISAQWYGVYQALIAGVPCVVAPGFSPSKYWNLVPEHGITYTLMLGAMAELLQQQPPSVTDTDNPLDYTVMAPLASDVSGFSKRFGVATEASYGMSEIGCVFIGRPETIVGGEVGFPREGYDFRLVDAAGGDTPVGEVGELWIRPHERLSILKEYHNLPEKTAESFVDGWFKTGDAFRRDAEDRYYFSDRMKDTLRRRGENVSSFEVERVVNEHPAVYESAVVGVPSEMSEEEIKAVIVPRSGSEIDPEELTRFLIERLPYFMVPRFVQITDELPKTPTQKVQKNSLRDGDSYGAVWDREAAGIVVTRQS